jgi:hypothetical protein
VQLVALLYGMRMLNRDAVEGDAPVGAPAASE